MVIKTESPKVRNDRIPILCLFLLVTFLCSTAPALAVVDDPAIRFNAAISAARAGNHDDALPVLKQLVADYPDNDQYLHDYITVLRWSGDNDKALELAAGLELEETPDYVIENLAPAALESMHYVTAARLYDHLLRSQPENTNYRRGLAWALLENGQPEQAYQVLEANTTELQTFIDQLTALARQTRDAESFGTSLTLYDKLVEMSTSPAIAKERIQLISRMGGSYLAESLAEHLDRSQNAAQADGFSATERMALTGDAIATRINWRPLSGLEHNDPNHETEIAIKLLLQQLQEYETQGTRYTAAGLRCQFDLIAAWHDHQDMDKVIELYQHLLEHGVDIPLYTRDAIADAYLTRRKPDKAITIYLDILADNPEDIDARLGLYYCLLDLEAHTSAQALIDDMAANEPAWYCDAAQHCTRNQRKLTLDIAAAMTHGYGERPDLVEATIQPLYARSPNNPRLRLSRAVVHYWRGEPHMALKEVELVKQTDPDYFDAAENRFSLLMGLMDFDEAQRELGIIEHKFGTSVRQQSLEKTWRNHNLNELSIDVNRSSNTGTQVSNRDLVIDSYLYARPQRIHFRPYAHSYYTRSKLTEGQITYHRLGIGMEYRDRDLQLNAEAHRSSLAGGGVALTGRWSPIDHWSFAATADSNDRDIPLRGRLNEDINGRSVGLEIAYIHNESLRIDGAHKRLSFSDDNLRRNTSLVIDKRLLACPHYRLNGRLGYFASTNTRPQAQASYYNPARDSSTELGLIQEWVQYRFYTASFRHRLETTIGRYAQSGFSSENIWSVGYEQQWSPHENFDIAYGLGRSQRSYDAVREFNNWLTLRLNWRF